jgi:amino acid permease
MSQAKVNNHDLIDEDRYEVNFPFWITVAFTLNYIIGSGFLTLPWAFESAGILLGIMILLLFGFFSTISVCFILETMARADKLDHFHGLHLKDEFYPLDNRIDNEPPPYLEHDVNGRVELAGLLSNNANNNNNNDTFQANDDSQRTIESHGVELHLRRKKEMTELCQLFLGDWGKNIYLIVISVYMYGSLWAYSTVFANSFSAAHENFINPAYSYYLFIIAFSCLVIPVSLLEFSEQIYLQVSLAIFRVVMVLAMILSIVLAYASEENQFQLPEGYSEHHNWNILFRCEWSQLYLLMPVAAFAFLFHHSVPALAEPITDKKQLNSLFSSALFITLIFYIALGIIISAYFGGNTDSSSNLNWRFYIGHGAPDHPLWAAAIVRFFILLFPAVDVASAFPLNAFTLGNNLMTAYYGKDIHLHDSNRSNTHFFRGIAAVPPIIGSLFVKDLGKITSWTGLTGFALVFIFPPLLSFAAKKKLDFIGIRSETIHSSFWTHIVWQIFLFVSGVLLFVYNGYILVTTKSK